MKSRTDADSSVLLFIFFFLLIRKIVYQCVFINALVYNKIFNYLLVI